MIRLACLACFIIFADSASADVPIFSVPPDANRVVDEIDDPAVVAEYPVVANICGLAENMVGPRSPLTFNLPDGGAVTLELRSFTLIDGFDPESSGFPPVPPCVDETHVAFVLYAVAVGKEFTLFVRQGRATGSLTGMLGRNGRAWWLRESGGRLVLLDMDTTLWSEPEDWSIDPDLLFRHGFEP